MGDRNLKEEIIEIIRNNPGGVDSKKISEVVLKFSDPNKDIAHQAIMGILNGDSRCYVGKDGNWLVRMVSRVGDAISAEEIPLKAVYILSGPEKMNVRNMLHVSIWSITEKPRPILTEWLIDPSTLNNDERFILLGRNDTRDECKDKEEIMGEISALLNDSMVIFLNAHQRSFLMRSLYCIGESLPEETMVISRLFHALGLKAPKQFSIFDCYRLLFGQDCIVAAAYQYGECFAECVFELKSRINNRGITIEEAINRYEEEHVLDINWSNKGFSMEGLRSLPVMPGVYGFKNCEGEYIYIGKAKNLRRRLVGYFRPTDESPSKLVTLRENACELTVHKCGSELESLIFEHRLIRKYSPSLNSKVEIIERKGSYIPIQDCIVILPHVEESKWMSVWFRRDQKIYMRPVSSRSEEDRDIFSELDTFFFSNVLPVSEYDFPEQEIVFRWVKRHYEELNVIQVSRMGSAGEVLEALRRNCTSKLC